MTIQADTVLERPRPIERGGKVDAYQSDLGVKAPAGSAN